MIQITSVRNNPFRNNWIEIEFILFNKIACSCSFEDKGLKDWNDIKTYIENQLTEDFNKSKQLEGKPSNLKTK